MTTMALFYLALIGIPLGVGYLVYQWIVLWRDLRKDGPNVRRFQGLADDIRECREHLLSYINTRRQPYDVYYDVSEQSLLSVEIGQLYRKLEKLKIPLLKDYTKFVNQERSLYLVSYLAILEKLAREGDLWTARGIDVEQIVIQIDSHAERHQC